MLNTLTSQHISLPFGFTESVELCKDYLRKRAFVVVQFVGHNQIIGLRKEDQTRVVFQFEGVDDLRTDVAILNQILH